MLVAQEGTDSHKPHSASTVVRGGRWAVGGCVPTLLPSQDQSKIRHTDQIDSQMLL